MKSKILTLFFSAISILLVAQERILLYNINIDIEASGELLIKEEITVNVEGQKIKRGIFRTFPTRYKDKLGNNFDVGFEVVEVLKDGRPEPWHTKKERNGIAVYTGEGSVLIPHGQYTYSLTFKTKRQVGFFDEFDELYFNAIGGDWGFVIEEAAVRVNLPTGAELIGYDAFAGLSGSTACDCTIEPNTNTVKYITTRPLEPGEQLTIVASWPRGFVAEPTFSQKLGWFFNSNRHILVAIFGMFFVFLLYYRKWKKYGVDPPKGTIIPLFDPPEGFSPAEIAFLQRMGMTQRVFTASLVSIATKGAIKIEQEKVLLGRKYFLRKVSNDTSALAPEEQSIFGTLFSGRDIIELNNKQHAIFAKATGNLQSALQKKLKPKYFSLNLKHLVSGFMISLAFTLVSFIISPGPLVPIVFGLLLILLLGLFAYLIMAPTPKGRAVMDEIEGFKMYVSTAESDLLNHQHPPDVTIERYEKLLPYAMAIGVENQWGKKFENYLAKTLDDTSRSYNPLWYSAAGMVAFSPASFSSSIGRTFSSAISSASTPPGSSSGSGGGGFSGGGGGGGGGGGW